MNYFGEGGAANLGPIETGLHATDNGPGWRLDGNFGEHSPLLTDHGPGYNLVLDGDGDGPGWGTIDTGHHDPGQRGGVFGPPETNYGPPENDVFLFGPPEGNGSIKLGPPEGDSPLH